MRSLLALLIAAPLLAQNPQATFDHTTILWSAAQRIGEHSSPNTAYGASIMEKNLLFFEGGFQGNSQHQIIPCGPGSSATQCVGEGSIRYDSVSAHFWTGASYRMFAGTTGNIGLVGTVTDNTVSTGVVGPTYTLSAATNGTMSAIVAGDYMDIRISTNTPTPLGGGGGDWAPTYAGGGNFYYQTADLPPGSAGITTGVLDMSAASNATVEIATIQDAGLTPSQNTNFLQMTGTWTVSIKLKQHSGTSTVYWTAVRPVSGGINCTNSGTPWAPTSTWATYTFNCTPAETTSTPSSSIVLSFMGQGQGIVYAKDAVFQKTYPVDPTNTTYMRDETIATLRALKLGTLRFWDNQLGETMPNWAKLPLDRMGTWYEISGYYPSGDVQQGLWDDLTEAEVLQVMPWINIPIGFTTAEVQEVMDFACGKAGSPYDAGPSTTYGLLRASYGHPASFCTTLPHIYFELGNEPWNNGFTGGSMQAQADGFGYLRYGQVAATLLGAIKAQPSYSSAAVTLVMGCQEVPYSSGGCADAHNADPYHDAIGIATYIGSNNSDFTSAATLAAEWQPDLSYSWQDVNNPSVGVFANNYAALQASSRPVPVVTYETNVSSMTFAPPANQQQLQTHVAAAMQGVNVIVRALEEQRFSNPAQNVLDLAQDGFYFNGVYYNIWGALKDIGGQYSNILGQTFVGRPQGLALQIANNANIGSLANVTWTNLPTYTVAASNGEPAGTNIPSAFAYYYLGTGTNTGKRAILAANTDPVNALTINLAGDLPIGATQKSALTFANPDLTNETAGSMNNISIVNSTISAPTTLTIQPGGMTSLIWSTTGETALQSDTVADNPGVNIHFSSGLYAGNAAKIVALLKHAGVRHYRDGFVGATYQNMMGAAGIHATYLVNQIFQGTTCAQATTFLNTVNNMEFLESPNEPNIQQPSGVYDTNWLSQLLTVMPTLATCVAANYPGVKLIGPSMAGTYEEVSADAMVPGGYEYASAPTLTVNTTGGTGYSATANMTGPANFQSVASVSVTQGSGATGSTCTITSSGGSGPGAAQLWSGGPFGTATYTCSVSGGVVTAGVLNTSINQYMNLTNAHAYQAGYCPDGCTYGSSDPQGNAYANWGWHIDRAQSYAPAMQVIATESGYYTFPPISQGVPETIEATYLPRLILAAVQKNILHTIKYELMDEATKLIGNTGLASYAPNVNNAQQWSYGLVRNDFTPKPAYWALANLIHLTADPGPAFIPGALNWTLSGTTTNVQHLLLQKRDGTFWLALWIGNVNSYNVAGSTLSPVTPQSVTVTITGGPTAHKQYAWDKTGSVTTTSVSAAALTLSATDTIKLIQIF